MQDIIGVVVMFLPLIFILWLANLADHQRERGQSDAAQVLAIVAYGLLVLFYLGGIVAGLLLQAVGALVRSGQLPPELANTYRQMGIDPAQIVEALPRMAVGLWLPAVLGIILLLRPVRRLFARWIPIDPDRTVHAIALSYPALILMNLLFTLGIGLGNLATLAQFDASQGVQLVSISGVWAQELLMALMGIIGVGWLARRTMVATFDRLAIRVPTLAQVGVGLGVGLAMVPVRAADRVHRQPYRNWHQRGRSEAEQPADRAAGRVDPGDPDPGPGSGHRRGDPDARRVAAALWAVPDGPAVRAAAQHLWPDAGHAVGVSARPGARHRPHPRQHHYLDGRAMRSTTAPWG